MSETQRTRAPTSCDPHPDLRVGSTIANYRLVSLLGQGGMGAVYAADHLYLGRQAAIKILHPQLAQNPQTAARFVTEARAISLLRHPGVVEVYEVGQAADGAVYIIMEYLPGQPLSAWLEQRAEPLSRDRQAVAAYEYSVLQIALQLASILRAVHERGVIHRDLKPDNIFLTADPRQPGGERVRLIDFGIAKIVSDAASKLPEPLPGFAPAERTAVGTVLGTPTYMAPEQWRGAGKPPSDRTDVYALGGILYLMLAGHPPFSSANLGELMLQHLSKSAPPLDQLGAAVHLPGVSALVQQMLAKRPSDRPSMAEVAQLLERQSAHGLVAWSSVPAAPAADWIRRAERSASPTVVTTRPRVKSPRRAQLAWTSAALLLFLVAILARAVL